MKIIVTGTSRGVGLSIALALLEAGHEVYGFSRSNSLISNSNYLHFCGDLTKQADIQSFLENIETVDVLINCAARASLNAYLLTEMNELDKIMKTNVIAPYFLSQEVSKKMIPQRFGRIINISTVGTVLNIEGEIQYIMSKAALEKFTEVAAKELAPFGITVNTIGLSLVETELLKGITEMQLKKLRAKLVFGDYLDVTDILHVILFLMDKSARFITGQTVNFGGVNR